MANVFDPIQLPPKADKAVIFLLWGKLRKGKISRFEMHDLTCHVLALINERVTCKSWAKTLDRERIEPEDAGQYVASFIWKRLPGVQLRVPCELTLIDYLIQAINNLLISRTRMAHRKSELHASQQPERWGAAGQLHDTEASINGLILHLRALYDGTRFSAETQSLYEYLVNQIASGNSIPSIDKVPRHLVESVGPDVFTVAVYRVNKETAAYAESL